MKEKNQPKGWFFSKWRRRRKEEENRRSKLCRVTSHIVLCAQKDRGWNMYVQRHAEALKGKEVLRRVRRSRRGFHGGGREGKKERGCGLKSRRKGRDGVRKVKKGPGASFHNAPWPFTLQHFRSRTCLPPPPFEICIKINKSFASSDKFNAFSSSIILYTRSFHPLYPYLYLLYMCPSFVTPRWNYDDIIDTIISI